MIAEARATTGAPSPLRVYIEPPVGAARDALDRKLDALAASGLSIERALRPQLTDVALLCVDARQEELRPDDAVAGLRSKSNGAPVVLVGGAATIAALRAQAGRDGADDALHLDEVDEDWARLLRWITTFQREVRAHNETRLAYRQAVRACGRGGWVWDLRANVISFDAAWKATLGYVDEEFGRDVDAWFLRVHPADRGPLREALEPLLTGKSRRLDLELRVQHRDRRYLWTRCIGELRQDDAGARIEGSQTDISAEKAADARLLAATRHDRLTGALGREAFLEALQLRLRDADQPFALGLCDVDDLKALNLRWGRHAGDEVLVWVAGMLEDRCGEQGLFGRVGSDAFAFVVEGDDVVAHARWLAGVRDELAGEHFVGRHGAEFQVAATFALAGRPASLADPSDLLRLADRAIDQARRSGEGLLVVPVDQGALALQATELLPAVAPVVTPAWCAPTPPR